MFSNEVAQALAHVGRELERALAKHPDPKFFNSPHEGRSVIDEEFQELTEHVFGDTGYSPEAYKEATQLAAMGVRYMLMVEAGHRRLREQRAELAARQTVVS